MSFSDQIAAVGRALLGPLGGTATYTPSGGSPVTVSGIFDSLYLEIDAGQAGVSSSGPAIFFLLEDLPEDPESAEDGAVVAVDGVRYMITRIKKDGIGGVVLHLHRVT